MKALRQAQDEVAIEFGENAKNFLALGVDINIIAQATDLSPEEIQAL